MDAFGQHGRHHVSLWAERYLPVDVQRRGARKSRGFIALTFCRPG
jgi:hypothetical protein